MADPIDILVGYLLKLRSLANQPGLSALVKRTERLGQLLRELIEEVLSATLTGNKKLLDKPIRKVPKTRVTDSAHALQERVDKCEYDALTRLLEEACRC